MGSSFFRFGFSNVCGEKDRETQEKQAHAGRAGKEDAGGACGVSRAFWFCLLFVLNSFPSPLFLLPIYLYFCFFHFLSS